MVSFGSAGHRSGYAMAIEKLAAGGVRAMGSGPRPR